jgi:hypothetical protein
MFASVLLRRPGFPLDDSWIHQVIARNFAQYHSLGFLPGELTTGSTSPLWSCILATLWTIFPAASPVVIGVWLSVLLFAGIGYVLKAITEEDCLPPSVSWCLAAGPLASGNFLWLGMIGMEHLLFILLSLCLVRQWLRSPSTRSRSDLLLLASFSLLLILTRPEGVFLALLLAVSMRIAGRTLRALSAVLAGFVAGGGALLVENWIVGHRFAPQTMQGRQFLYRVSPEGALRMRFDYLGQIVARCIKVWSFSFSREYLHHFGLLVGGPAVLVLALFLVAACLYLVARHANRVLLLVIWSLLIVMLYAIVLPSTGHGGRYLSLLLMLFLPLLFLGFFRCLLWLHLGPRPSWVVVGVFAMVTGVWSFGLWRSATRSQIYQIETEHGAMAEWLQQNLPSDVRGNRQFAVFDIGRIGYRFHGNVVDLGGLMDPAFLGYVAQNRTATYLAQHHIEYLVLPSEAGDDSADWRRSLHLQDSSMLRLIPLHSVCVDPYTDWVAENSASTAYACQRAYKLVYDDKQHP